MTSARHIVSFSLNTRAAIIVAVLAAAAPTASAQPSPSVPPPPTKNWRAVTVGARVRDVRQGPDGFLYALANEKNGRLLRIVPQ